MTRTTTDIYRNDRILGLADDELSDGLYRHWGASLAGMLREDATLAVSSDCREDSEAFKNDLVEALLAKGVNVVDLGRIPSDLASHGAETVDADGFVCVTGGSQMPGWNGLRWRLHDCPFSLEEQIRKLRQGEQDSPVSHDPKARGRYRRFDIVFSWISWLQSVWFDTPGSNFRILIDPRHGNWAGLAGKALQGIFPQMTIEAIHDIPLENFGNLIPVAHSSIAQEALCREIKWRHADLGVIFDVDAGSFTVIDGHGVPLLPEEFCWFVLRDLFGAALEGEVFLHDVNCPSFLIDEGIRRGGTPVVVRRGDESFTEAMNKTNALVGIGSEGEIYFRGARGNRIVIFAVCWLIDYLVTNRKDLATLRKTFPRFYTTPELLTPQASLERITAALSEAWATEPVETIEGIDFRVPDGRIHVRPIPDFSQTGFHFEAGDRPSLQRLVDLTVSALENLDHLGFFLEEQFAARVTKRYHFEE